MTVAFAFRLSGARRVNVHWSHFKDRDASKFDKIKWYEPFELADNEEYLGFHGHCGDEQTEGESIAVPHTHADWYRCLSH